MKMSDWNSPKLRTLTDKQLVALEHRAHKIVHCTRSADMLTDVCYMLENVHSILRSRGLCKEGSSV